MNRLKKLLAIAEEIGVKASIKEIGGQFYANINGKSFLVIGYSHFRDKCVELKEYVPPKAIDLTVRILRIEERAMEHMDKYKED
ncbi:hypothetical protein POF51_29640 [Brevibacillus sp. AG]|uniref:hypothetical protein n=1 Tax=Brevibacillus sp. AG TaxID=3020891 RepID=UPI0023301747|nr:hypothetical protein [Brevibacillus sp. AG]MDC0764887.1 hypothetical protein [Brevibacillus sp. AG]